MKEKRGIRKNKKNKCFAALLLILCTMAAGCGKGKDRSVAGIQSCGVLRVAVPDTATTLFRQDEETGEYQGVEAELAASIAEALGVAVQYLPADREEFAGKLSTGEADIAIGSVREDSYLIQNCLHSTVYGSGYVYVVTLRGFYVGDIMAFARKTVGVSTQLAPESTNDLYTVEGITLQRYSDTSSVSNDLIGGKIAGYVCYQPEAEMLLEMGDFQVQDAADVGREDYVILAPFGSTELMEGIDVVIRQYLTEQQEGVPSEDESQEDVEKLQ